MDPRAEYARRLELSKTLASRLARRDDAFGNARLGLFLVGLVLAYLWWKGSLHFGLPVVAFVGFVVLLVVHGRVIAARRRAEGKSAYHERGLARLDDRWAGKGVSGIRFLDEEHPYASDLDLFGEGSLFERLCQARTASGETCLAGWLLSPAPIAEIRARHEAIDDLRGRIDLREDLALLGDDVRSGVAPDSLAGWGRVEQKRASMLTRGLVGLVAGVALVLAIGWLADSWSVWPFLGLLAIEAVIAAGFARRVTNALADVEERSGELQTLAGLLARIEQEPFTSARLRELKAALDEHGSTASARIGRLARLVLWVEARHNIYFAMFSSFFLWKTQFALAVEDWRAGEGASIARWLDVVGQFEAYVSLASFAFENPDDPFPELVDLEDGPILEGEGLGHPLLPIAQAVRNDLKLGGDLRVLSVRRVEHVGQEHLAPDRGEPMPCWPRRGQPSGPGGSGFPP